MVLATVLAAPPTRKNQRAVSCPAPISAKVPYLCASRLMLNAFWSVFSLSSFMRCAWVSSACLQLEQQIFALHGVANVHGDLIHHAIARCINGSLHLHCFERYQLVTLRDLGTHTDRQRGDQAGNRSAHFGGLRRICFHPCLDRWFH